ncbi:MAG TPA: FAD:protein FMN transferase, partial [Ktedonobacterales bacterium]|nr:FAD:protein FMN transferase [Ktedonobacterales bacterium]
MAPFHSGAARREGAFARPLDAPGHQPAVVFVPSEELRRQPRRIIEESRPLMGTTVSVQIAAASGWEAQARTAVARCMVWLEEVNARLSRFDRASEISLLNRSAGQWFAASDTLFAAVAVALAAAHSSGGLFDPALASLIEALGYDRDFTQIAHREVAPAGTAVPLPTIKPGAWRAITLDHARRRIRLPEGIALDLGGIAKGWAADVAFERYCTGFPGALINVGGDLRAQGGPQFGQGWTVGVRDPRSDGLLANPAEPRYLDVLTFSQGGLATSGAVRRWWLREGERQHHLIDP